MDIKKYYFYKFSENKVFVVWTTVLFIETCILEKKERKMDLDEAQESLNNNELELEQNKKCTR